MGKWKPDSYEDRLLVSYHEQVNGRIYTEVPTPWGGGYKDWPKGYRNRYIDAIRITVSNDNEIIPFANHGSEVLRAVEDADVELIEIKSLLNRPVIGQVIAGDDLFQVDYEPADIHRVVLCEEADPALKWVCEQRKITVEIVEPIQT